MEKVEGGERRRTIPMKRTIKDKESAAKKPKVTQKLHGLENQGATCYLNSVLQVFFMTTELHERLDPKSDKELRDLFEKLKKETCRTENITTYFDIENVRQQCDAAECLEMILNKVSPDASQVFKGELKYSTKCSKRHNINTETNPFLTLPLSLKDDNYSTFNVESGFDNTFQTKSFTGENLVYCEQCEKRTEATSECEMVTFPRILVLLLKRFDFDNNTMSYFKSDRCVEMPHTLQRENHTYNLCGVVNHMGGLKGGHYTATILCNEDQAWYDCNDRHVRKLEEQLFAGDAETYKSRAAYLLVYRASESLKDEVEDQQNEQSRDKRDLQRKCGKDDHHVRRQSSQEYRQERKGHETNEKKEKENEGHVSSLNMNERAGNSLLPDDPNTIRSCKNRQDNLRKAEEGMRPSKKQEGEANISTHLSNFGAAEVGTSSFSERTRSTNIQKKPLCIALIVCGCLLIVILVIVLSTLNLS